MSENPNPDDNNSGLTLGTVRDLIRSMIPGTGTGTSDMRSNPDSAVREQVRREVETLTRRQQAERDRTEREKKLEERLAALETRPEQIPVQRSRLHRVMGWGE